ncbi:MAG TPA: hypothetical protein VMB66_04310 [Candidatus Acidoferrales bacterium]|nr:hypothetical protein [Candidatus Acidoferrales bacterium]
MKHRILALMLALTVASWAQTATQATPSNPEQSNAPAATSKCACCDRMAKSDAKAGDFCCARHKMQSADSKDMASCCSGKDAKSCCGKDAKACARKDKTASGCKDCGKDKTASSCCGGQCGNDGAGCCCKKKTETARNCCGDHRQG